MTNTLPKTCTRCGSTKPSAAFYLRDSKCTDGPRRSHCKTCVNEARRNRPHGSLLTQIANHYADKSQPLSREAEAAIYTTDPIPDAALASYRKQVQARKARDARRRRRLADQVLPMRFARMECAA